MKYLFDIIHEYDDEHGHVRVKRIATVKATVLQIISFLWEWEGKFFHEEEHHRIMAEPLLVQTDLSKVSPAQADCRDSKIVVVTDDGIQYADMLEEISTDVPATIYDLTMICHSADINPGKSTVWKDMMFKPGDSVAVVKKTHFKGRKRIVR